MSKKTIPVVCRQCGNVFEAHFHNAMYCPSCRELRRKESSRVAWKRKKVKMELERVRGGVEQQKRFNLEIKHMAELGMSYGMYSYWKETHQDEYRKWMEEHGVNFV